MKVSAQYAEAHFAEVLATARSGESVEIAEAEMPTIKLVISYPSATVEPGRRILGAGVGELIVPSFEEWQAMDIDLDVPLMSSGEV